MQAQNARFFCLVAVFCALAARGFAQSPICLLEGRAAPGYEAGTATLPQTLSWAGSSLYVAFEGASRVELSLVASMASNLTDGVNWLRFYVDDAVVGDGFTSYKILGQNLSIPVSTDVHTLRIAKLSDPAKGDVTISDITLNAGRFLLPAVPRLASGRRILVFGDSYTIGYGDAGAFIPNTCNSSYDQLPSSLTGLCTTVGITDQEECAAYAQVLNGNALAAFGPLVADAYTADLQLLASSGTGMVGFSYGLQANPNLSVSQVKQLFPNSQLMFNRTLLRSPESTYSLTSWMPQVVVLASGLNDWNAVPPDFDQEDWLQLAIAFLQQIDSAYNGVTILVVLWSEAAQNAYQSIGGDGESMYTEAIIALVDEANLRGLDSVYLVALNGSYSTSQWCQGHPSAAAQAIVAQEIAAAIEESVPSWTMDKPVNLTIDQMAIRPNLNLVNPQSTPPVPSLAPANVVETFSTALNTSAG